MRTGNHTTTTQNLYLVVNPTLALCATLPALVLTGSPAIAAWVAAWTTMVKIGITGHPARRFSDIARTSPGPDIPINLGRVWGAYYIEQALHRAFFFCRVRWFGSGRTEWFMGLPGVWGVVGYALYFFI